MGLRSDGRLAWILAWERRGWERVGESGRGEGAIVSLRDKAVSERHTRSQGVHVLEAKGPFYDDTKYMNIIDIQQSA